MGPPINHMNPAFGVALTQMKRGEMAESISVVEWEMGEFSKEGAPSEADNVCHGGMMM